MSALTTNVTSDYVDPSFTALGGVPVVATLMGSKFTLSGVTVNREEKTYTQSLIPYEENNGVIVGSWTLALIPNSLFGPDSYYLVRVGTKEEYEIVVPVTIGETPVEMSSLVRDGSEASDKSIYVGNMTLDGDLVVNGSIEINGTLEAGTIQQNVTFDIGDIPLFSGNFEIVGNLVVSGIVKATGAVTVIA